MDSRDWQEAFRLVDDAQLLWKACTEVIRDRVKEGVWLSSFAEVAAVDIDDEELVLAVPSVLIKHRLETRYIELMRDVIEEVGGGTRELVIEVRANSKPRAPELDPLDDNLSDASSDAEADETSGSRGSRTAGGRPPIDGKGLSKYTFETFVEGSSNRFAYAAAFAVAERPGMAYNPLFIYSNPGLGKTHLLRAIAHYVGENYPDFRVVYVPSETFLNQFIEAIRSGESEAFKRRYREVDVLLVDDIQFIEGKKETQEEFFHTFNSLYESNRQIILSSDRHPDHIPTLEDRLRSRFKMGLPVDVQPPDLETRLAILRKKAERETTPVPNEVLELIATHVTDNIRVLEGALTRVSAFASLNQGGLTVDVAERLLTDLLTDRQPRPITPKVILEKVSETFGFSVEELVGESRRRPLSTARQIAMYLARELTELSFPAIAREFGGRDHTTVIHGVDKIRERMREDRQIYDQVNGLIQEIRAGR